MLTSIELLETPDDTPRRSPFRALAKEDLVQDDAEGPDVGTRGRRIAFADLGRHVVRRADEHADHRAVGEIGREPEVGQHEASVIHAQHVVGLDVAVDDARFVNRRQSGDHAGRVGESLGQRTQRLVLLDEIAQRAAGRELHREEAVAVGVADVEDAADVRVANRAAEAQLALRTASPSADRASAPA